MNSIRPYNSELKDNLIVTLTFSFSLEVLQFVDLLEQKRKFVVAHQLLRSATSVGATVREAQNAESKRDFIHKMKIAAKEADETEYWLELCNQSENYPNTTNILPKILVIKKIISKIISTAKIRLEKQEKLKK